MSEQLIKKLEQIIRETFRYQHDQWKYLVEVMLLPFWEQHRNWVTENYRMRGLFQRIESRNYKINLRDTALLYVMTFVSEEVFAAFRDYLGEDVRKVLDHLVWAPLANEHEIKKQLGIEISYIENEGRFYGQRKYLKKRFQLFPSQISYSWQAERTTYHLFFPGEIRLHLIAFYEKPDDFYLKEVEHLPETLTIFEDKGQILSELSLIKLYHRQGKIRRGKSGKPHANTYSGMRKKLGLREFYMEKNTHKILHNIRTAMLANLWVCMPEKSTAKEAGKDLLKHLFDKYYFKEKLKHHFLLLHLNGLTNVNGYYITEFSKVFLELLKDIQLNQWLSIKNVHQWLFYRGLKIAAVTYEAANQYLSYTSTYHSIPIENENFTQIVRLPSLKAYFFLYGAYGLFDLAYDKPDTREPGESCYSPFDGLQYVRLTPLGAYILGLTNEYEVETLVDEGTYELSPYNLIIRIAAHSPPDKEDRLKNFAQALGNRRFKVNHESFLKNCQHKEDVEAQITLFHQLITNRPPKIWQDFFEEIRVRISPLEPVNRVKVFQLAKDSDLLRLVAQDEQLQAIIHKAENYQIIIKEKDLPQLKSRLKAFGYMI